MRTPPTRYRVVLTCIALAIASGGCNFSTPSGVDSSGEGVGEQARVEKGLVTDFSRQRRCRRDLPLYGKFATLNTTWAVSHFSERICTDGQSLVAGSRITSDGWVEKLGESELKVSAAWDWATPAAGRFTPSGRATGASASTLTDVHFFSVNPFKTVDPFEPVCEDTVKAKAEVTLETERGDKIYGDIMYGEVYELGFKTKGDGQEQFIVVHANEGTGRFENVRGRYLIHAIFNLAEGTVEGRIRGLVSMPCRTGDRDVERPEAGTATPLPEADVPLTSPSRVGF